MRRVERWEANDGQIFDNEEACEAYEHKKKWIEKMCNDLYLREADPDEIYKWIIENTNGFKGS